MMKEGRLCELCNGEASVYCDADSAYLCWRCDRRVHAANFLVSRHLRRLTCSSCRSFDDPSLAISGPGSDPILSICRSCRPDPTTPSPSTSSASSCVSTSSSSPPMKSPEARSAAARVLEGWGKGMGVRRWRRCSDVAARVMGSCRGTAMAAVPLRAAMAAAMWFAVRVCDRTCEGKMRRLERCSGLPAKAIVFYEARIARAVGWRREAEPPAAAEEGSGECSGEF